MAGLMVLAASSLGPASATATVHIRLGGATTLDPISQMAMPWFSASYPNTNFPNYKGAIGSGEGQAQLFAGQLDLAQSSSACNDANANPTLYGPTLYRCADLVETAFAKDALSIVTNSAQTCVSGLTTQQVADLYMGRITNWNQLNPACGNHPLIPRAWAIGSDTRASFMKVAGIFCLDDPINCKSTGYLAENAVISNTGTVNTAWPRLSSDNEMVTAIRSNSWQIGYVTLAQADPGFHAPSASVTRYVQDPTHMYDWGCHEAQAQRGDVVVILDFGMPMYDSSHGYSTKLPGTTIVVSTGQIEQYSELFLKGYLDCIITSGQRLTLGVGTGNQVGGRVQYGHGQAWAQMVKNVDYRIHNMPCGENGEYTCDASRYLAVRGAIDIEEDLDKWARSDDTRNWVNGYLSIPSPLPYYDFGSCSICSYQDPIFGGFTPPASQPGNGLWTEEDVWYVAWGAVAALPLPEIYNTIGRNAYQWQALSLYAYLYHGQRMDIKGVLTQAGACVDRDCGGMNLSPADGWGYLYEALNSDARTAQDLPWVTDITWQQQ